MNCDRTAIPMALAMAALTLVLGACSASGTGDGRGETYFYSFETDLEDWAAEGVDLGDPPIEWDIAASDSMASDGEQSLRYYLANYNDQGKIWLRKTFPAGIGTRWRVELSYDLATRDFGMANLWTIISGAVAAPFEVPADLPYQGHTGNGADDDVGWVWMHKSYQTQVIAGPDGLIHVLIGFWGTWETPRTYYVDAVSVRLVPLF